MLSKFSVKKPMTVFVAVVLIIVLGVVAYLRMTPDLLPNMDLPYAMIMTVYAGQTPETVETTVTKPLEQSLSTVDGVKRRVGTGMGRCQGSRCEWRIAKILKETGVNPEPLF